MDSGEKEAIVKAKYLDLASGIFLFMFSIALFIGAQNVKTLAVSSIGSGFFPSVVAVLLAATSIPIILGGIKEARKKSEPARKQEGEREKEKTRPRTWAVLATFAVMTAYAAVMPIAGFMISTAVYLFLQMNIMAVKERRRQGIFACTSVITAVAVYYLFVKVFHLMLPAGILG